MEAQKQRYLDILQVEKKAHIFQFLTLIIRLHVPYLEGRGT